MNINDALEGKFIVIDGTDGSGKETQAKLLADTLENTKLINFPRYTENVSGKVIRTLLDGAHGNFLALDPLVASLFYAADRLESAPLLRDWLKNGYTVIADRFTSSNAIHQGGKIKEEVDRRSFLDRLDLLEHDVLTIPRPDAIVYLHVPHKTSIDLIRERAVQTGKTPDQAESDANHLLAAQGSALRILQDEKSNHWIRVNCARGGKMRSREEIHREILRKLLIFFKKR